jgi:hypothetical protein
VQFSFSDHWRVGGGGRGAQAPSSPSFRIWGGGGRGDPLHFFEYLYSLHNNSNSCQKASGVLYSLRVENSMFSYNNILTGPCSSATLGELSELIDPINFNEFMTLA